MNEKLCFTTPLNSELHKHYYEFRACKLFEYCYPKRVELICSDKPDLQAVDKSLGIEVAEAILTQDAIVSGEFTKYEFGKKNAEDRKRCVQIIQKNGGRVDELCLSFPSHTLDDELQNYKDIINKKIRKLPQYRSQGYSHMGLFIVCSSIPIPFKIDTLRELFAAAQQTGTDKFDFIWLSYPCAVLLYEESTKQIVIHKVNPQVYDEIAVNARVEVEAKFER